MIQFIKKFPFISFKRKLTANDYHEAIIHQTNVVSDNNSYLMKACKDLLTENRISLNKIRFVTDTSFLYDIDNNNINPSYKTMIPIKKKHPVIEIGKPEHTILVHLGENRTLNNYAHLKKLAHKSKRGVALLVSDELDDVMWLANLDDAVGYYKESFYGLEYES